MPTLPPKQMFQHSDLLKEALTYDEHTRVYSISLARWVSRAVAFVPFYHVAVPLDFPLL